MPVQPLYDEQETAPAQDAVRTLANHLPEPIVLAGGWGVWTTVNEEFERDQGAAYLGSRDADYGFTIDPEWTVEELRNSTYARALKKIVELGFHPSGTTRYSRWIHRDTHKILTEEEARRYGTHDLVQLFVDPMVDAIHPRHGEVFKVKPLDTPLLRPVFDSHENRVDGIWRQDLDSTSGDLARHEILVVSRTTKG